LITRPTAPRGRANAWWGPIVEPDPDADLDLADWDASDDSTITESVPAFAVAPSSADARWADVAMILLDASTATHGVRQINGLDVIDTDGASGGSFYTSGAERGQPPYQTDPMAFQVIKLDTLPTGSAIYNLAGMGHDEDDGLYINVLVVELDGNPRWALEVYTNTDGRIPETRRFSTIAADTAPHVIGLRLNGPDAELWVDGVNLTLTEPDEPWTMVVPFEMRTPFWLDTTAPAVAVDGAHGQFRLVGHPSDAKVAAVFSELMTKWGIS
jgi:hypothetical protein